MLLADRADADCHPQLRRANSCIPMLFDFRMQLRTLARHMRHLRPNFAR